LFLIIANVLGHPKEVGGLTSYFLCGGGMDVFWNDPILGYQCTKTMHKHVMIFERTKQVIYLGKLPEFQIKSALRSVNLVLLHHLK
jgi:hypothetical protein